MILTNNHLYTQEATPEETELVSQSLMVSVPGAYFTKAYKNKFWDGKKKFYDKRTKKCGSGFLEMLFDLAEEKDFLLRVEDGRKEIRVPKVMSAKRWRAHLKSVGFEVNNYQSAMQVKAARHGLHSYIKGAIHWPRGIFEITTGGGKTSLAGLILQTLKKKKALFMVARLGLLYQTKDVLERILQEPVGIIGDTERRYERVTLVMAQTAGKLIKEGDAEFESFVKSVKIAILDEAHHLQDNSNYQDVLDLCSQAYFRFALTATPQLRNDPGDAQLVGSFGQTIFKIKSKKLRDRGVLAHVKTWVITNKTKFIAPKNKNALKASGIYKNLDRNRIIVEAAQKFKDANWPCLVLVDTPLQHGQAVQDAFSLLTGHKPPLINYKTPMQERRRLLTALEDGRISCIIASGGVFGEGIDAPLIRGLIRAEGGHSSIKTLQAAGRGMRRKPYPNVLYLVDIWDVSNKILELDSRKRIQIYRDEEYELHEVDGAEQIHISEIEA